jgi:GNAT superfamily N-acetyltransferase
VDYGTAAQDALVIRPRLESDIPQAAAGLVEVHATDGYPVEGVGQAEAWLTPPGLLQAWVAEIAGKVVGHVAVSRSSDEDAVSLWLNRSGSNADQVAVLARLFVVPEARKRAVGERLMRTAVEFAQENGVRLVLDVMTKDAAAIRLYTRLGWTELGHAIHTFGEGRQATEAICFVSPTAD